MPAIVSKCSQSQHAPDQAISPTQLLTFKCCFFAMVPFFYSKVPFRSLLEHLHLWSFPFNCSLKTAKNKGIIPTPYFDYSSYSVRLFQSKDRHVSVSFEQLCLNKHSKELSSNDLSFSLSKGEMFSLRTSAFPSLSRTVSCACHSCKGSSGHVHSFIRFSSREGKLRGVWERVLNKLIHS